MGQPLLGREFKLVNEEVWLKVPDLPWDIGEKGILFHSPMQKVGSKQKIKGQWLDDGLVIQGRLDNMFISGGKYSAGRS